MARIRTFKPDFTGDAKIARLTRDARLTFLLMFTEADDEGRMVGTAKRLAGSLYPHDDDVTPKKLDRWIAELVDQGMVRDYTVDNIRYLWIVNFAKHQKIDHKTDSRLPPPPENPGGLREESANGGANHSRPPSDRLDPDLGSGLDQSANGTFREPIDPDPLDPPPTIDHHESKTELADRWHSVLAKHGSKATLEDAERVVGGLLPHASPAVIDERIGYIDQSAAALTSAGYLATTVSNWLNQHGQPS